MADVLGKKISELAETTDLAGLYTIGSDRNNQSKKVPLQFVKEAADYANAQGDYAKGVGDTVQGNTGVDEYPVFSASTQYAAGSVVRYNDKLYRFTSLHPAGSWVGTDAVETSIKAETELKLTELESEIGDVGLIAGGVFVKINPQKSNGYIDRSGNLLSTSSSTFFHTEPISLQKGDELLISLESNSAVAPLSSYADGKYKAMIIGDAAIREYSYIATSEINVVVSGYSSDLDYIKIKRTSVTDNISFVKDEQVKIKSDIGIINSNIGYAYKGQDLITKEEDWERGKYIAYTGGTVSLGIYAISKPIKLAGITKLIYKGSFGQNTAIGFYNAPYAHSLNAVKVVKWSDFGVSAEIRDEVELEVPSDAQYICVTCDVDYINTAYLKVAEFVTHDDVNARLQQLENAKSRLVDDLLLETIEQDNPLHRIKESPCLTPSIRSWGFVGDSLSSGEIWGWENIDLEIDNGEIGKQILPSGEKTNAEQFSISKPVLISGSYPRVAVEYNDGIDLNGVATIAECDINGNISKVISLGGSELKYTTSTLGTTYIIICYPKANIPKCRMVVKKAMDKYDISWGQFLCRSCGADGYNYSTGGRQAKTIINGTTERDLQGLLADNQKQAYIIALGQNDGGYIDAEKGVTNPSQYYEVIGNTEDCVALDSPKSHGNSFYGYYSELLVSIKNKFSDSLIFLTTIPDSGRKEISESIREIYEYYKPTYGNSLYLIDLERYLSGYPQQQFELNGIHLNAQGYQYMAMVFSTYIDWILRTNIEDLKHLAFIGTGYYGNDPL